MNNNQALELEKYETPEAFYQDYKSKFNQWMWIWLAALIACFALLVADFVITLVFQDSFLKTFYFKLGTNAAAEVGKLTSNMILNTYIYRVASIVAYMLIFAYLIYAIISYKISANKNQTFIRQNMWLGILTFVVAIYAVFNLIQYMYNNALNEYAPFAIAIFAVELISSILYVLIYFIPAGQIRKLVKYNLFVVQNIQFKLIQKKFRESQANGGNNPFDIFNIFNNMAAEFNANAQDASESNSEEEDEIARQYHEAKEKAAKKEPYNPSTSMDEEKDQAMAKLLSMPNQQLFQMAAILNISGYEDMSKDELASLIYNYTKQAQERYAQTQKEIHQDNNDKK
ncbi:hypothetical protein [Mycoplasma sp. Z663]|uniref:hypothetical protein n=1 Tax=Mycoplasma sp. Z663 TaxID=3401686 RepID=UPI003AB0FBD0